MITEINPSEELGVLERQFNKACMVAFINADLFNRANLDVRKSVVLYDADKEFVYALEEMPTEEVLKNLFYKTKIRHWSKGI